MDFNELFKNASMGDEIALEELIDAAEQGDADAQYLLSCLYEQDGPFYNEEQADYWLEMAVYNGNQEAKKKLSERPLRAKKNNQCEEDASQLSEELETHYVESKKEKTRWKIRIIWWILFPILLALYYMHKCEKDAESHRKFEELIKPMDQKSENFNPSEHIQIDSSLNIKADEQYIEHLKKKGER